MLQSPGLMSTNTGLAPASTMVSAVAAKVKGVVMTSWPGPMPFGHQGDQERLGAAGDGDAVLGAGVGGELGFQLGHLGAHDELAVVEHGLDARVDAGLEGLVLGLEVDELHAQLSISSQRASTSR